MVTTRIDVLDSVLFHSGRNNRKIEFPPPNKETWLDIFKIHSQKINLTRGINLRKTLELMLYGSFRDWSEGCVHKS